MLPLLLIQCAGKDTGPWWGQCLGKWFKAVLVTVRSSQWQPGEFSSEYKKRGSYSRESYWYKDVEAFLLPYSFLEISFHTRLLHSYVCATLRMGCRSQTWGREDQEQLSAIAQHKHNQPAGRWASRAWINTGLLDLRYCLGYFSC